MIKSDGMNMYKFLWSLLKIPKHNEFKCNKKGWHLTLVTSLDASFYNDLVCRISKIYITYCKIFDWIIWQITHYNTVGCQKLIQHIVKLRTRAKK